MKKLLFTFILLLFNIVVFSQKQLDSLWNIWNNKSLHDTIRLNAFVDINEILLTINPDTVLILSEDLFSLANKKNLINYKAIAITNQGRAYYFLGEYEKAAEKFNKSLSYNITTNNKSNIANIYNHLGIISDEKGDYQTALKLYFKSLRLYEEINKEEGKALLLMNIGTIYFNNGDNDRALNYYNQSLEYNKKLNYSSGISDCYSNIANVYVSKYDYEKGIEYNLKSLAIKIKGNDMQGLIHSYNNLGDIYIKLKDFKKALEYLNKSIEISEKVGYKMGITVGYANIGDIFLKQNQLDEAENYLIKSLTLSKEIGYKELIKANYLLLTELMQKKNNYKKALEYQILYTEIKDSLINEESSRLIEEMNAKYESEKKENYIELLKKDKELLTQNIAIEEAKFYRQRLFNYIFISIIILSFIIALFIYSRYKTNKKLNDVLIKANEELSQKNNLIENQKEKIVDNITYAKRIQQSILPDESEIKKYLPDSFIFYQSKDIVSGDFYWYSKIGDNIIIAAIDCTGHGVSGAFMSMIGNTLLNQIVNEKHIVSPAEILRLLNIGVYEAMNQDKEEGTFARDGMDMALCNINFITKKIEFAGAQNSLFVLNKDELTSIKGDSHSIGGGELNSNPYKQTYTNHTIEINNNMSVYLTTDGYMDQFGGPNRKKFGIKQFRDLLKTIHQLPASEQKIKIKNSYFQWKSSEIQTDDILVVGIKF